MIRALAAMTARTLFSLACVFGIVTAILIYLSYRLIATLVNGRPAEPIRDASLHTVMAIAELAKALRERMPEQ